jgi:hypothetical protein
MGVVVTAIRDNGELVILEAMEKWTRAEAAGPHGSLRQRMMAKDFTRWCEARNLDAGTLDDHMRTTFFELLGEEEETQCMAG